MSTNLVSPILRFAGHNDAWEQHKWSETVDISTDMVDPKTGQYDELPHVAPGNIESFTGRLYDNVKLVKDENLISGKFRFNAGDIIYGKINPQLGKYVFATFSGLTSADAYVLNAKNGIDQKFLYAVLQTQDFYNYSVSVSKRSGMPKINRDELNAYSFIAPSIIEQTEIGEFLLRIDKLITLHQHQYDRLLQTRKSLLLNMFPRPGKTAPEIRFVGFTAAWEQHQLLELLSQPITDGPHETPNLVEEGIPFISVDAIVDNKIDFDRRRGYITEEYDLECRKKYSPQRDDVYLVKSGSTVGKVAIVETDERFNIWSPLAAMRANKGVLLPKYLYYFLQLEDIQDEVLVKSKGGTQPNLSMRILEQFAVRLPNVEEQKKISDSLGALDSLITLYQRKLSIFSNLKKAMLQKMFPIGGRA